MVPNLIKKAIGAVGGELWATAGLAGLFALWQLPIPLLVPIAVMWFMVLVSLSLLNRVPGEQPRGSKVVVTILMSSALVITLAAVAVGLFRTPEVVKRIETEITGAIKVAGTSESHSMRCAECPASWRSESQAVLLTSAPIVQERRTVSFVPFIVELTSSQVVLVALWAFAGFFALLAIFVGFGSVIAAVAATAPRSAGNAPDSPDGKTGAQ
jgi:hypothetical protein